MLGALNAIGLLASIEEVIPSFDELHTKYLLQILWDRLKSKDPATPFTIPPAPVPLDYPMVNGSLVNRNAKLLPPFCQGFQLPQDQPRL